MNSFEGAIAMRSKLACCVLLLMTSPLRAVAGDLPDLIAAEGEILVTTVHAVGAQVYQCEFDTAGNLVWQFREPIATLFVDGKTVGRHYAGPNWELSDGSAASGKVISDAPGASPADIPLLKLSVATRRGQGQLTDVTTIQRLNTKGGTAFGNCDSHGAFLSVPYSADYAFYSGHNWSRFRTTGKGG
jgi:hypothetical protein